MIYTRWILAADGLSLSYGRIRFWGTRGRPTNVSDGRHISCISWRICIRAEVLKNHFSISQSFSGSGDGYLVVAANLRSCGNAQTRNPCTSGVYIFSTVNSNYHYQGWEGCIKKCGVCQKQSDPEWKRIKTYIPCSMSIRIKTEKKKMMEFISTKVMVYHFGRASELGKG